MIPDSQTNFLYLADTLPNKYPDFFKRFEKVLKEDKIPFQFLPNTEDVWAVDYMPIQINEENFVQFTYNPDYLQSKKYQKTISDVDSIVKALGLKTTKSKLVLDGGNISKSTDKVIMCDKVFHENSHIPERELIKLLKELFQVDKLFFIPWDKNDFTGHADGMVRFLDEDTVLINDYSIEDLKFQRSFRMALHNAGLDWIELPYTPHNDQPLTSADGLYLNYLQMEQAIIVPTFESPNDDKAVKVLEDVFKGFSISTVQAKDLAEDGGILNCITWNIQK
jgi:agmatine deiminase